MENMSTSDLLAIIVLLASLLVTGAAGWFAFHARKIGRISSSVASIEKVLEQSAASGSARDKLLKIETLLVERSDDPDEGGLKGTLDEIKSLVANNEESAAAQLGELRESLEELQEKLTGSVAANIAEAKSEVAELARKIGDEFASQAALTEKSISSAYSNVLSEVATGEQLKVLTDRLTNEFRSAMRAMGSYQEISITTVASATLESVGEGLGDAVRNDVSEKFDELGGKVDSISRTIVELGTGNKYEAPELA